jgi:hypothetical protein
MLERFFWKVPEFILSEFKETRIFPNYLVGIWPNELGALRKIAEQIRFKIEFARMKKWPNGIYPNNFMSDNVIMPNHYKNVTRSRDCEVRVFDGENLMNVGIRLGNQTSRSHRLSSIWLWLILLINIWLFYHQKLA